MSVAPCGQSAAALAALSVYQCEQDTPALSLPNSEIYLVARFGPGAGNGLDVHAFGLRSTLHRKALRSGQRTVTARLQLGVQEAVLGVPASALAGNLVLLEDLWGAAASQLREQLAAANSTRAAAGVLEQAIAQRSSKTTRNSDRTRFARAVAAHVSSSSVSTAARQLGVSERHLRRVFQDVTGVSPKQYAQLVRFRRALQAARQHGTPSWARIAADAGYYDQAHLIADFRRVTGRTPQALLGELRSLPWIG